MSLLTRFRYNSSLNKKRTPSSAARASFWYAACGALQKGIGVIVIPVYTRIMDPVAYGTYTIFQSWFSLLFVFTSLGLANYVLNNGMLKYKDDRDGFSSAMLGLSGAVTLAFVAAFLAFPSFWASVFGLAAPLVFLLFVRCLISPSYELWAARLRYEFRYKGVVALTLALTALVPVVSIPIILISEDKAAAALVCQVVVMSLAYAVPFVSLLRKSRKLFNKEYWLYALRFNLPLIPSMFAMLALNQMNRIVIANMVGDAQAAMFSVACSVGSVSMFIYSALEQAYRPWFYQGMEKDERFSADRVAMLLIVIVGLASGLIALFSPEIMMIFAPQEYASAIDAVAPIAASSVLIMLFSILVTVEYFYEETKLIPLASIAAALANLVLAVLLIPIFGYFVAGYVTVACYSILALGHVFFCRRAIKRHHAGCAPVSAWRLFSFTAIIVAAILAVQLLYGWLFIRVGLLVVFTVLAFTNRNKLIEFLQSR